MFPSQLPAFLGGCQWNPTCLQAGCFCDVLTSQCWSALSLNHPLEPVCEPALCYKRNELAFVLPGMAVQGRSEGDQLFKEPIQTRKQPGDRLCLVWSRLLLPFFFLCFLEELLELQFLKTFQILLSWFCWVFVLTHRWDSATGGEEFL